VNQNFILCEKYEKAVKESNLLKEDLEQAELKCENIQKQLRSKLKN